MHSTILDFRIDGMQLGDSRDGYSNTGEISPSAKYTVVGVVSHAKPVTSHSDYRDSVADSDLLSLPNHHAEPSTHSASNNHGSPFTKSKSGVAWWLGNRRIPNTETR